MKKQKILVLACTVLSVTTLIGGISLASENSLSDKESIKETVKILKSMANQDLDEVENEINKVNKDVSALNFKIEHSKRRFDDVAFLGDSITTYLAEDRILGKTNVLAKKGEHISQAKNHLSELAKLKAKSVVILYGANDMTSVEAERFKEEYIKLIKEIKAQNKGIKVYIQEPLPVYEPYSIKQDSRLTNANVKRFSKKAREAAAEAGATFLPSNGLINGKNVYAKDGIHLAESFYRNWLFFLNNNI